MLLENNLELTVFLLGLLGGRLYWDKTTLDVLGLYDSKLEQGWKLLEVNICLNLNYNVYISLINIRFNYFILYYIL